MIYALSITRHFSNVRPTTTPLLVIGDDLSPVFFFFFSRGDIDLFRRSNQLNDHVKPSFSVSRSAVPWFGHEPNFGRGPRSLRNQKHHLNYSQEEDMTHSRDRRAMREWIQPKRPIPLDSNVHYYSTRNTPDGPERNGVPEKAVVDRDLWAPVAASDSSRQFRVATTEVNTMNPQGSLNQNEYLPRYLVWGVWNSSLCAATCDLRLRRRRPPTR